jgi:hypothetical protein
MGATNPGGKPSYSSLAECGGRGISFKIVRGTIGSLAKFAASRRASSRVISFVVKSSDWRIIEKLAALGATEPPLQRLAQSTYCANHPAVNGSNVRRHVRERLLARLPRHPE